MNLEEATAKIVELEAENRELRERLAELERRLQLNSINSSKAPSSDGLSARKRRTPSLRSQSSRKSGGQSGHRGETLMSVQAPDEIIEYPAPEHCPGCGTDLWGTEVSSIIKRQVFDIVAPRMVVSEHQVRVKHCPHCQQRVQREFAQGVNAPVQYGSRIRSIVSYLHHQQYVPEERLSELLKDVFGCSMTGATIETLTHTVAAACMPLMQEIIRDVKLATTKHLDETGLRIQGKTQWLHVVSSLTTTWYRTSAKRKELGSLQGLDGVIVHDHWKPYFQIQGVEHGLCNAHHLRELKALEEIEQESWASRLSQLLRLALRLKHRYPKAVPQLLQVRIQNLYQRIVARGLDFHEARPPLPQISQRGRPKRRVGHNLLLRLKAFADDVLRFLCQPDVPFSNNLAERDLRMMKLKQKISGGFRSDTGAHDFAVIRSVLSTARKRGLNLLDILMTAVQGKTPTLSSSLPE